MQKGIEDYQDGHSLKYTKLERSLIIVNKGSGFFLSYQPLLESVLLDCFPVMISEICCEWCFLKAWELCFFLSNIDGWTKIEIFLWWKTITRLYCMWPKGIGTIPSWNNHENIACWWAGVVHAGKNSLHKNNLCRSTTCCY